MDLDQALVFSVLALTLGLFIHGKWRYDVVALFALLVLVLLKIIPPRFAFSGFGHPAVITVASVLIVGTGLKNAGLIDVLVNLMAKAGNKQWLQLISLCGAVMLVSAFMNNVGALAVFMPVAIQIARKSNRSPSLYLMPLAFSSLLGGMTTLIGTPPNIIISSFRMQETAHGFQMFDYLPVGFSVAIAGLLFVTLIGWRLIPLRKSSQTAEELFEIEKYVTELKILENSSLIGKTIYEFESQVAKELMVLGLARYGQRMSTPSAYERLKEGDILVVEADPEAMQKAIDVASVELVSDHEISKQVLGSSSVEMMECIVMPNAGLEGKAAGSLRLRYRFGINLLGVARKGKRLRQRLSQIQFQVGDILLLRGGASALQEAMTHLGCIPLAERYLNLGKPRRLKRSLALFATSIAAVSMGWIPVEVAFMGVALIMVVTGILSLKQIYESIDWPIIVLLAAMIPLGRALESTGGAKLIADSLLYLSASLSPAWILALILIGTMFLSDLVNNATAAILMAPVAINVATNLGVSIDPYLMAVGIGASCAFLTPIGHQCNALVFGPGGYQFKDYWKMGLPLEVLIAIISIPLLLYFWPLY